MITDSGADILAVWLLELYIGMFGQLICLHTGATNSKNDRVSDQMGQHSLELCDYQRLESDMCISNQ